MADYEFASPSRKRYHAAGENYEIVATQEGARASPKKVKIQNKQENKKLFEWLALLPNFERLLRLSNTVAKRPTGENGKAKTAQQDQKTQKMQKARADQKQENKKFFE